MVSSIIRNVDDKTINLNQFDITILENYIILYVQID